MIQSLFTAEEKVALFWTAVFSGVAWLVGYLAGNLMAGVLFLTAIYCFVAKEDAKKKNDQDRN